MLHSSNNKRICLGIDFTARDRGTIACHPVEGSGDALKEIRLRLSGPGGVRIESFPAESDALRLRYGGLISGWWTAEAEACNDAGRKEWRAAQVRFRAGDSGEAHLILNFERFSGDLS